MRYIALIILMSAVALGATALPATRTEQIAISALIAEQNALKELRAQVETREKNLRAAHEALVSETVTRLGLPKGTQLDYSSEGWTIAPVRS